MEIEYIYPDPKDDRDLDAQLKKMQKENTLGCLIMGLFLLGGLFIFLTLLPILLIILGYSIIVLAVYIAYKAWLEEPVLNLIQKLKSRRTGGRPARSPPPNPFSQTKKHPPPKEQVFLYKTQYRPHSLADTYRTHSLTDTYQPHSLAEASDNL